MRPLGKLFSLTYAILDCTSSVFWNDVCRCEVPVRQSFQGLYVTTSASYPPSSPSTAWSMKRRADTLYRMSVKGYARSAPRDRRVIV